MVVTESVVVIIIGPFLGLLLLRSDSPLLDHSIGWVIVCLYLEQVLLGSDVLVVVGTYNDLSLGRYW